MKRCHIIVILAFICSLAACSNKQPAADAQMPKADAVLTAKIVQMYDSQFLLAGTGAADLYMLASVLDIYDEDNQITNADALKPGQTVEVGYSGMVMESYPAQLGTPVYIKIIEKGEDIVGFYEKILNDLWKVDEGLNSDISLLAFDLSQVTNLTNAEKSALVYIVSGAHSLEGITGTFDELSEQGYIDKENLYFENGLLFNFKVTNVTKDSFSFDVTKWRSGLGAYTFHECKAVKTDNGWSYTIGSEMIS